MRVYIEILKNSFKASISYRIDVMLATVGNIIGLFVQIAIWTALMHNSSKVNTGIGFVTLKEMVTYSILSITISALAWSAAPKVNQKFRSGEIAMDLIKPINFKYYILSDLFGRCMSRIFTHVVPIIAVSMLFFGVQFVSIQNLFLFIIAVLNGIFIHLMITYLVGLINFWTMSVGPYGSFIATLSSFFSGSFVPLWFFPSVFYNIAQFLPFRLIYYVPISIYLGKVNMYETALLILQQFLWIACLIAVEKVIWLKGTKRLAIQGG